MTDLDAAYREVDENIKKGCQGCQCNPPESQGQAWHICHAERRAVAELVMAVLHLGTANSDGACWHCGSKRGHGAYCPVPKKQARIAALFEPAPSGQKEDAMNVQEKAD